jgi:hypothetical protein
VGAKRGSTFAIAHDHQHSGRVYFFVRANSTVNPPFFHTFSTGSLRHRWRATLNDVSVWGKRGEKSAARRAMTRRIWQWTAAVCLCPALAHAQEAPLFRLFLTNGAVVACLGEYAHVGDRVVFSLPLGDASAPTQLMSLPARSVDWSRTDQYAGALRARRYADSRGEADFSALAGDVAAVLNEIALTNDPGRKLQLALEARRRLEAWPREHYNYTVGDVRQIVQLVDEAISEMRAAAGEQQFDLSLEANVIPAIPAPLLAEPTPAEALTTAAALVDVADDPAERVSLLESMAHVLEAHTATLPPAVAAHLQVLVRDRLRDEQIIEAGYTRLSVTASGEAKARATRADVRGVERLLAHVQSEDERLGHKRPERVSALLATVQDELDAARRLRLARDQWSLKVGTFRSYRHAMAGPLASLSLMAASLDDIKRLAGPDTTALPGLVHRAAQVLRALGSIVPPPDLASTHALIESAARLAEQAVTTRQAAAASGVMDQAWQASSAAAGALMLLGKAKQEIESALAPPGR